MKHYNSEGCLLPIIVMVISIALGALFFELVWNSDLPMWLKWIILR